MGRGNLFVQVLDLRLADIPFLRPGFQVFLILRQDSLYVLQIVIRFPQFGFHPVRTDKEQIQVQHLQAGGQIQIDPCVFRVFLQRAQAVLQLIQQVIHPGNILLGACQFFVRLFLTGTEFDDTGGLFKDLAAVLALPGQDFINPALADNGIALLADTGVAEQIHHILEPAGRAVQEILAFPAAVDPASHLDLRVVKRKASIFIVKDKGNFTVTEGLSALCAAENHVLHAGAAQDFGALLTEHPANRVAYIAFSGSVGSHNRGDAFLEDNLSPLRKGLESVKLQLL